MSRIKKIKILILGSNGFFGKNFKKSLHKEEYEIFCLDKTNINLLDYISLNTYFKTTQPNIVLHCAGIVGSSEINKLNNQFDILNNNIIINSNILNCCKENNVDKIFIFSTYRMFSDDIVEQYDETNLIHNTDRFMEHSNSGYLLSKHILQRQIQVYNKYDKNKIICFILPNVYGKYDMFSVNGRIVPSLICKMYDAMQNNTNVNINCNENTELNLVYINDIIKIVETCFYNDLSGDIIVFNEENIVTLQEISHYIKTVMNFQNDVLFKNEIPVTSTNIMKPNISKFNTYFQEFKYTEILPSLQETVEYYISLQKIVN